MKIWSDLRASFQEEFITLKMTIREKLLIFVKIFNPAKSFYKENNELVLRNVLK